MGTLLADIDSITYATYRDSSSTNSPAQYPAINIEVDYVGDGSSYTTLVWEPVYASSKWAINCFVQTVRRQVFKHDIRVIPYPVHGVCSEHRSAGYRQ